jgi:hypothetical protein
MNHNLKAFDFLPHWKPSKCNNYTSNRNAERNVPFFQKSKNNNKLTFVSTSVVLRRVELIGLEQVGSIEGIAWRKGLSGLISSNVLEDKVHVGVGLWRKLFMTRRRALDMFLCGNGE